MSLAAEFMSAMNPTAEMPWKHLEFNKRSLHENIKLVESLLFSLTAT